MWKFAVRIWRFFFPYKFSVAVKIFDGFETMGVATLTVEGKTPQAVYADMEEKFRAFLRGIYPEEAGYRVVTSKVVLDGWGQIGISPYYLAQNPALSAVLQQVLKS